MKTLPPSSTDLFGFKISEESWERCGPKEEVEQSRADRFGKRVVIAVMGFRDVELSAVGKLSSPLLRVAARNGSRF
jgi:hypothetical protein